MDIEKLFQSLGIGLSKIIRYSFPGILLLCAFAVVEPNKVKLIYGTLGWQVSIFSILVLGIGLYATHRSLVIPVHHLLGCVLLWIGDKLFRTTTENSLSPTRWLRSMEIPVFRRMLAYRELRHYWLTEKETKALDVQHAENGLPVMFSEAIIVVAIYSWQIHSQCPSQSPSHFPTWPIIFALILFILSALSGMQQHRIECAHFKADPNRANEIIKKFKNPNKKIVSSPA